MTTHIKPTALSRALRVKPSRKLLTPLHKQHFSSAAPPQTSSNHSTESLNSKTDTASEYTHYTTSIHEKFFSKHMHPPKSFKLNDFETPITIAALDAEVALLEAVNSLHDVETKGKELLKKVKIEARNSKEGLRMGYGGWEYGGHFHHGLSEAGIGCLPWYW